MEKQLRVFKNFGLTTSMISRYLMTGFILKHFTKDKMEWRRRAVQMVSDRASYLLRKIHFNVEYNYSRPHLFADGQNYFMVCNHMSYMDIVFLSAGKPAVFVTSVEMQNTPFLGEVSDYGGSYFVERRDRSKIPQEVRDLADILRHGLHVFVFPESTSTHGMHIMPFKKAMFTAAIESGKDVLPICLRYEEVDGEPFTEENKDRLCWYGDMPFFAHMTQMMTMKSVKVSVNYLNPISVKQFPDRAALAEQAYAQITKKYFENRPPSFKPWPLDRKK